MCLEYHSIAHIIQCLLYSMSCSVVCGLPVAAFHFFPLSTTDDDALLSVTKPITWEWVFLLLSLPFRSHGERAFCCLQCLKGSMIGQVHTVDHRNVQYVHFSPPVVGMHIQLAHCLGRATVALFGNYDDAAAAEVVVDAVNAEHRVLWFIFNSCTLDYGSSALEHTWAHCCCECCGKLFILFHSQHTLLYFLPLFSLHLHRQFFLVIRSLPYIFR